VPQAKVFAGNDTSILINQPLQLDAADLNKSGFNQVGESRREIIYFKGI
jgi:hypothetical protein